MGRLTDDMTRLNSEIRAFHGSCEAFINDLKRDVAEMQADFRNTRTEMAEKTKAERVAFVSDLKATVAGIRLEFADDLEGARQAWFGLSSAKRRAKEKTKAEQQFAEAEVKATEEEKVVPDDLTAISGIGPGRMARLNEAGVYTFAQLAERPPENLQRILGKLLTMDDIEKLTSQARELAGS